jgi:hypothetical protein
MLGNFLPIYWANLPCRLERLGEPLIGGASPQPYPPLSWIVRPALA